MQFTKMHGAGNDYVYVDCFAQPLPEDASALAKQIADRHYGVGGDGLILIAPTPDGDAEMRMYNADGSPSEMCGNGIRCVAKYVHDHGIAQQESLTIVSAGVPYDLRVETQNGKVESVRVDMGEPTLTPAEIPTTIERNPVVDAPFVLGERSLKVTCVSMGNPHCVVFLPDVTDQDVQVTGPAIEHDARFPNRTNVEFVKVVDRASVNQRTWERGSGETLACGTGAAAVCVAGALTGRTERAIDVHLPGGTLRLNWHEDNHVYMTGPAVEVFSGEWPD
ncbi:MAG: diaminopimelate epimerase [Planctomycetota bacterium]